MGEEITKEKYEHVTHSFGESLLWVDEGYYTQEEIKYFLACFENRQKALEKSMNKE